jgi:REP element-mobilizing transposase RayT
MARYVGICPLFRELAAQRSCEMLEGHMVQGHVHMLIRIPPKHSVAEVVGYIKGKSAISVVDSLAVGIATSMGRISGLGVMPSPRLALRNPRFARTSKTKSSWTASFDEKGTIRG